MQDASSFGYYSLMAVFCLLIGTGCKNESRPEYIPIPIIAKNDAGDAYVGSTVCMQCHADIVQDHLSTAHFNTSAFADTLTVKGSFAANENTFVLNSDVEFKMTQEDAGLYQKIFSGSALHPFYVSKTDIAIGSGQKGQSYLTWSGTGLFQQQVSYYEPTKSWINSPMFPNGKLVKPRPVIPKCIGCHATYAKPLSDNPQSNQFDKQNLVLGIDCERCHGPSKNHVAYRNNSNEITEDDIISFKNFNRQQRLDACAVCHSGLDVNTEQGILSFVMGDTLRSKPVTSKVENLDVHGNQYGLLVQSKCFKKTPKMDCITCHNVHKNERGQHFKFNTICLSCHSNATTIHDKDQHGDTSNCISCHMPLQNSETLVININNKDSIRPLRVRSHLIDIYPTDSIAFKIK